MSSPSQIRPEALAAALIVTGSFPDLVSWAMRAFGVKNGAPTGEVKANGAGRSNGEAKGGDGAKKRVRANGGHTSRQAAAKHNEALLALMRANPGARSTEIIRMNGRPRNSTVSSLKRLEKAGLVAHAGRGKSMVADPDSLEAATPKPAGWIEPLSGNRVAPCCRRTGPRQMTLAWSPIDWRRERPEKRESQKVVRGASGRPLLLAPGR
jgi:hypothetical protein